MEHTLADTVPGRFAGRVALVTGGGSGIGRAAALGFARENALVVVAGRRPEPLEETVAAIDAAGGKADAVTADVTRPDEVARLVATTVERHGGLHVAFNNAGAFAFGSLHETPEEVWERMVAVNLTGVFLCMKHEIAHMRAHGGGVIVNNASVVGTHLPVPKLTAYAAAKAAVSALTRAAALEYVGEGVRINAVSPGPSDTAMSLRPGETEADRARRLAGELPIGRVGRLDEIVSAVLWLASPGSGFTVGHDLVVAGGAGV